MKEGIMRVGVIAVSAAAGILLATGLASCSNNNDEVPENNVENVQQRDMNKVEQYSNVEGYPHLVRACIDGVSFAFWGDNVIRVAEWDEMYCAIPPSPALLESPPTGAPTGEPEPVQ